MRPPSSWTFSLSSVASYFYRRTVRIYPLVIVLTALKVLYMFAHGSGFFPDQKRDLCYIISSTLLLPRNDPPFLEVSWPLGYEMLCYTLFALAILFGRRMVSLALPHAFCCLLLNLPFAPKFPLPIRFFFSPYVLEFYMGCLAAYIFLTRPPGRPVAVASIGLGVVLLVAGIIDYHSALVGSVSDLSHLYWGTGLFLIVLGIVVIENQTGSRAPRWLCFLGDASYSIYLSHTSVVVLVGFLIKQRLAALHPHLMIILSLLAGMGVLAGVLCYVYVERPLLKWLQGKAPRRQTAAAAAA